MSTSKANSILSEHISCISTIDKREIDVRISGTQPRNLCDITQCFDRPSVCNAFVMLLLCSFLDVAHLCKRPCPSVAP